MFRRLVCEAAVSAWIAVSPSKADTTALDSVVLCFARKLLRDKVLKRISQPNDTEGVGLFRKMDDRSVWRLICCVTVGVELVVRRLGWWLTIAKDIKTHVFITATVFGAFPFEP